MFNRYENSLVFLKSSKEKSDKISINSNLKNRKERS